MRGCPAKARVGRISSQRSGRPAPAAPSETERHILAHWRRAASSRNGSVRSRVCRAATCSLTWRSSNGFTSFDTPILMPAIDKAESPIDTWAVRLGSMRQFAAIAGRDRIVAVPRMSAC